MTEDVLGFQEIYDNFHPRVKSYLTRLMGSQEAEDLTQEVFIKMGQALPSFRGESKLSTWIYRIATNAATDRMRSPAFQLRKRAMYEPDVFLNRPVIKIPSIEQQIIRNEMNNCIRSIVEDLPENYSIVIMLSEFEGFKNMR